MDGKRAAYRAGDVEADYFRIQRTAVRDREEFDREGRRDRPRGRPGPGGAALSGRGAGLRRQQKAGEAAAFERARREEREGGLGRPSRQPGFRAAENVGAGPRPGGLADRHEPLPRLYVGGAACGTKNGAAHRTGQDADAGPRGAAGAGNQGFPSCQALFDQGGVRA